MNSNYTQPTLVRCFPCFNAMQMPGGQPLLPIEDSYPCKLLGYDVAKLQRGITAKITEDIWLCEKHYRWIVLKERDNTNLPSTPETITR